MTRWLGKSLALLIILLALLWSADRLFPLPLPADDQARVVLDEDGTPLWRFADAEGVWRYPVTPEQVAPAYLQALLSYEDRWFYQHPGVNPLALGRAAWQNLSGGRVVSGGSTLSMQVARLLDPHSRSLSGKLKQLWRTLQLEWHLSKTEILTLYLNRAPFGGTLQGVAAASWAYLGKPPSQLTHAEAASSSGAATVKSLMHSKKPKKPTRSWCTSLCSRLWIAAMRPTTSPSRSARKYSASACAKNGFWARSSSFRTSARNGGTQFGSRRCSR